ncbi:MAG: ribonuclease HII [Chloroflexota bacterium]
MRRGCQVVAGVDEVGRGAWAGPLVAAAVSFARPHRAERLGLKDSKQLSPAAREALFDEIVAAAAAVGVGAVAADEVDILGLNRANELAMARAVRALGVAPDHLLIDAVRLSDERWEQSALVHGDGRSVSIAAASIIAKVTRDRWMAALDAVHPGYGWRSNKGYGTLDHAAALSKLGPSAIHRQSFAPVAAAAAGR